MTTQQKQITEMNREAARLIAAEVREALGPVAERLGLSVTVGGGSFDPAAGSFMPKVTLALGDAEEAARRAFDADKRGFFVGVIPTLEYGDTVRSGSKTFRVVALQVDRGSRARGLTALPIRGPAPDLPRERGLSICS